MKTSVSEIYLLEHTGRKLLQTATSSRCRHCHDVVKVIFRVDKLVVAVTKGSASCDLDDCVVFKRVADLGTIFKLLVVSLYSEQ